MPKIGIKMAQDYTVLNLGPPIPKNNINPQYITIVAGTGNNLATIFFLPGNRNDRFGKEPPPDVLLMDNLETSLSTTVYKDCGNTGGAIIEIFIKTRASKMVDHPVYFMEEIGPLIEISCPHEEFFNSAFGIWIGRKYFSDRCCRPTRMQEL